MTHVILMALAPVFFVMALGFAAGRMHAIDNRHVDSLNTLVMNFAVPASLFVAIGSAPRSEVLRQGSLFAIEGAVMLVVYLAWYALQRRVTGASRGEAATQALTVAFPNIAGVALPLVSAILGPAGAVSAAIALAAGAILVTPLTLVLLELSGDKAQAEPRSAAARVLQSLRRALLKPVVLAPALGAVLSLSGLGLDTVASASLHLIGQAAAGAALFLTGLVLSAQSLRLNPRIMGATLTGDVIRPLLVVAIVHLFAVPAAIGNVAILLAVVPSGFFGILFGLSHRQDSAEVGSMVLASTVFSIVTLAIAIAMLYPR
jgi:malonate transporter